jgi:hypothetical protein
MLVELQFANEIDYFHRMLYGTSKTIAEHMFEGSSYLEVKKVYSINIVYCDLGQGIDYIYHGKTRFMGLHENDELKLSELQCKTFGKENASDIYPEYYILRVNKFADVTKDSLDEWLYFFKHDEIKEEFRAKGIRKARKLLAVENLAPDEREAYEYMASNRSHERSMFNSYRDEGIMEGRREGREEREKLGKELEKRDKEIEKRDGEIEKRDKELEKRDEEIEKLLAEVERLKQKK